MICRKAATSRIDAARAASAAAAAASACRCGGGGLGIGTIVVLGLIGWALGIDPSVLIGGAEILTGGSQPQRAGAVAAARRTGAPQDDMGRFVARVLGSTEVVWKDSLRQGRQDLPRADAGAVLGRDASGCGGVAQSAMGPFYCPNDQKIYLDTSFFRRDRDRFRGCDVGSKACQFAAGLRDRARGRPSRAEPARHPAEGAAGAARGRQQGGRQPHPGAGRVAGRLLRRRLGEPRERSLESQGKPAFIDPGDIEAALAHRRRDRRRHAAAKRAQGYVVPDSFTHGTSEQRQRWFNAGFKAGTIASCNTFASAQL